MDVTVPLENRAYAIYRDQMSMLPTQNKQQDPTNRRKKRFRDSGDPENEN